VKAGRAGTARASIGETRPRALRLLLLFAGALLVRLIYLLQIRGNPTFLHPTADPLRYHERALGILAGDWVGGEIFFHSSPLYPYFLALNYWWNGQSIFWTYAAQATIDALTVVLVFETARRLAGRTIAWLSGLLALGYQAFIFFTGEMLEITLVLACLAGAVLLLVASADTAAQAAGATGPGRMGGQAGSARSAPGGRRDDVRASRAPAPKHDSRRLAGAGFLLGLAVLGKPNLLAAVPFLLAGWNLQAGRRWRAFARPLPVCLLGLAAAILPVTARNAIVGGDFVLTTSNGGINFYIGNHTQADGTFRVEANLQDDLGTSSAQAAERAVGRPLKPSEVSAYWFRQGLAYVFGHPWNALVLTGRKLLLMLNGYEIPNHFDLSFFQRYSSLLRLTPIRFATVLPLAVCGLIAAWPQRRRLAIPYLLLAGTVLSLLPFFVTARYRLPAVPALIFFAALGLAALASHAPALAARLGLARPPGGVLLPLAGLALGIVLVALPFYAPEDFYAHQYGAIASVYKQQGRMPEAAEEYRRALALAPGAVLMRNSLAVCLLEMGDSAGGEEMLRAAIASDPGYAPAWRNLGRLLAQKGDTLAAIAAERRACDADPYLTTAASDLARLLFARGDYAESERVLREALSRAPRDENILWNLAVLLGTRLGRGGEAEALLDRLSAVRSDSPEVRRLRAFLRDQGRATGATVARPAGLE